MQLCIALLAHCQQGVVLLAWLMVLKSGMAKSCSYHNTTISLAAVASETGVADELALLCLFCVACEHASNETLEGSLDFTDCIVRLYIPTQCQFKLNQRKRNETAVLTTPDQTCWLAEAL